MQVIGLEFPDTDIFNVSNEDRISHLDPLIARRDIDRSIFDMEISLHDRLVAGEPCKFAFLEKDLDGPREDEPGLTEFPAQQKRARPTGPAPLGLNSHGA